MWYVGEDRSIEKIGGINCDSMKLELLANKRITASPPISMIVLQHFQPPSERWLGSSGQFFLFLDTVLEVN